MVTIPESVSVKNMNDYREHKEVPEIVANSCDCEGLYKNKHIKLPLPNETPIFSGTFLQTLFAGEKKGKYQSL